VVGLEAVDYINKLAFRHKTLNATMKEHSVFADYEDVKQIQEEECNVFIKSILCVIGVPLEEIWPENNTLDTKSRRDLRDLLSKLDVAIIHDGDHGVKIYHDRSVIGQWFRPTIIQKKDETNPIRSKRFFYEIIFKSQSVFEEEP
jgi:hypothetical protein